MTQVRKARNFARRRRLLTAAILALTIGLVGTLTAAAAITGKASPSKAGSANSLLAATTTVNGDASCGYSGTTLFTESTVMRWAQINGTGLDSKFIAYANDENSTLLGVNTATHMGTTSPDHAPNASGGDTTQHDALGRPYYPALYISSVSSPGSWTKPGDPTPQEPGDWQGGGSPRNLTNLSAGTGPFVDDVFGSWVVGTQTTNPSAAPGQVGTLGNGPLSTTVNTTTITLQSALTKTVYVNDAIVVATTGHTQTFKASAQANPGSSSISVVGAKANFAYPNGSTVSDTTAQTGNYARQSTLPAKNDWNLGSSFGFDQPVGQTFANMGDEGYGTEFRWNVNELTDNSGAVLTPGNWYKIQVIEHDGDQNKGGDSGEFCTLVRIPGAPSLKTDATGQITDGNASTVNAHLKQPINSTIKDAAFVSKTTGLPNVTGSVKFRLFFVPVGTSLAQTSDACTATYEITTGGFPDTETLTSTSDPSTAVSVGYDTTGKGLGTYYWQAQYLHGTDANYTDGDPETCGTETDQMVDARILLSPHEATNIINNDHVVTATVQTTEDGTNFTAVTGAEVDTNLLPATTNATYVPPTAAGAKCTTGAAGTCTITITDGTVETVNMHATSTFTQTGMVTGSSFTRSTSDASGQCTVDANGNSTCDAIKHWINPATELSVGDKLIGLGADASGTVTYTVYPTSGDCTNGTNGIDETTRDSNGNPIPFTSGNAPPSKTITVDPPASGGTTTYYFSAHYEGSEGTVTTSCTKETASTSS